MIPVKLFNFCLLKHHIQNQSRITHTTKPLRFEVEGTEKGLLKRVQHQEQMT